MATKREREREDLFPIFVQMEEARNLAIFYVLPSKWLPPYEYYGEECDPF